MTIATIPARVPNGHEAGRSLAVRAHVTQPATQQERTAAWLKSRASRLLDEGYRFRALDDTRVACHKPDGTIYTIDVVAGICTCPATVKCSHQILAEYLCRIHARHFARPALEWFDNLCTCGCPSWSYEARLGGSSSGRTARLSVCPRGCDSRRVVVARVVWGREVAL